jgi:hypothetical protein
MMSRRMKPRPNPTPLPVLFIHIVMNSRGSIQFLNPSFRKRGNGGVIGRYLPVGSTTTAEVGLLGGG